MASHRDGGDVVNHNFHDFQETISSVENLFQRPLQEVTDQIVNIHKVLVAYDNAAFTFLCYCKKVNEYYNYTSERADIVNGLSNSDDDNAEQFKHFGQQTKEQLEQISRLAVEMLPSLDKFVDFSQQLLPEINEHLGMVSGKMQSAVDELTALCNSNVIQCLLTIRNHSDDTTAMMKATGFEMNKLSAPQPFLGRKMVGGESQKSNSKSNIDSKSRILTNPNNEYNLLESVDLVNEPVERRRRLHRNSNAAPSSQGSVEFDDDYEEEAPLKRRKSKNNEDDEEYIPDNDNKFSEKDGTVTYGRSSKRLRSASKYEINESVVELDDDGNEYNGQSSTMKSIDKILSKRIDMEKEKDSFYEDDYYEYVSNQDIDNGGDMPECLSLKSASSPKKDETSFSNSITMDDDGRDECLSVGSLPKSNSNSNKVVVRSKMCSSAVDQINDYRSDQSEAEDEVQFLEDTTFVDTKKSTADFDSSAVSKPINHKPNEGAASYGKLSAVSRSRKENSDIDDSDISHEFIENYSHNQNLNRIKPSNMLRMTSSYSGNCNLDEVEFTNNLIDNSNFMEVPMNLSQLNGSTPIQPSNTFLSGNGRYTIDNTLGQHDYENDHENSMQALSSTFKNRKEHNSPGIIYQRSSASKATVKPDVIDLV